MTTPTTSTHTTTDAEDQLGTPVASAGDTLTVAAWRDPTVEQTRGAIPTDSDEALITGRAGVFEPGECRRVTRRVGQ